MKGISERPSVAVSRAIGLAAGRGAADCAGSICPFRKTRRRRVLTERCPENQATNIGQRVPTEDRGLSPLHGYAHGEVRSVVL